MNLSLLEKVDRLLSLSETQSNESEIRELLTEIFDRREELRTLVCETGESRKDGEILSRCLQKLRTLNNKKESALSKCEFSFVELDRLLEGVSLCADILLSEKDLSLFFTAQKAAVACCPALIIDAFLNLISNAVKFSDGSEIDANLSLRGRQCVISVFEKSGSDLGALKAKSGLRSVQNTAKLHGGRLLFSSEKNRFGAQMALSLELPRGKRFHAPPFSSYLENRFSPVHVGLSDCLLQ